MSNLYLNNGQDFHWKRTSEQYEFVTLDEVKDHLNIFDSCENEYLMHLMITACQLTESYVGDFFNATSIALYTPTFCEVTLPHQGAESITSITYLDADNVSQTLSDTHYYLDLTTRQPTVRFESGFSSPTISTRNNPVTITYVTKLGEIARDSEGVLECWGANDVKMAVLMYCSEMYFNRDNNSETKLTRLPLCSERLLDKYRRVVI